MGETRVASAVAFGGESDGPDLYVEFRKDGKPIDPSPWWMERVSGRTGNDS
jgi:septal ring factor EnvC (AmiA/AmiB activator)